MTRNSWVGFLNVRQACECGRREFIFIYFGLRARIAVSTERRAQGCSGACHLASRTALSFAIYGHEG